MVFGAFHADSGFLQSQMKFDRVRTSVKEKERLLDGLLKESGMTLKDLNILIVAFKDIDELEIYAKRKSGATYNKLITYKICSRSGHLGPKRKQGDNQVPEGLYHIEQFNPVSNFYLSLGLNYPNQADRRKTKATDLGGDIFIHGSCVTIGCLPMTDDKIKEIYLLAINARENGQNQIPVYVFPYKMTDQNFLKYKSLYHENKALLSFWENLKTAYDRFIGNNKEIAFSVDSKGDYQVK